MNKRSKNLFSVLIAFSFLLAVFFLFGMYWVRAKIEHNREKIVSTVQSMIGFPIHFERLDIQWQGLSMGIAFKGIVIFDTPDPVPFMKMDSIVVRMGLKELLAGNQKKPNSIILDGLQIVIGYSQTSAFSVLGLQGEPLSTAVDYEKLLLFLREQPEIFLKSAKISWRFSEDNSLTQWINGKFYFSLENEQGFRFQGTQQLEICDGLRTPNIAWEFFMDAPLQVINTRWKLGTNKVECGAKLPEDGPWQTHCIADMHHLKILDLKQYYHPKTHDSEVLQWLFYAIPTGTIRHAFLKIDDFLGAPRWKASVQFSGVELDYSADWPAIQRAVGTVTVDQSNIEIAADHAKIFGTAIKTLKAVIKPVGVDQSYQLSINGKLEADLKQGLEFLERSPLKSMEKILQSFDVAGDMALDLNLQIPLKNPNDVILQGLISVTDASAMMPGYAQPFQMLKGIVNFSNDRLHINLGGVLQGEQLQCDFQSTRQADPHKETHWTMQVRSKGNTWLDGKTFLKKNGDIEVDLKTLQLKTGMQGLSSDFSFLGSSKSTITFVCQELRYQDHLFNSVNLKLKPKSYGYEIEDFYAETDISEISLRGEWHLQEPYTVLRGQITSVDIGKLFTQWGYTNALKDASGYLNYDLAFGSHPLQWDFQKMSGKVNVKIDSGRIVGVEPGLGRVIGLLNVGNIKRRLQLDFSDLFKRGFAFDKISGTIFLKKGIFTTDKLMIDSPSAKIELAGTAMSKDKNIDLTLAVMPHVGVGIPVVTALAIGNPAVGAGVWLFDKLTGSTMKKMTQQTYRVTGTWEVPKIEDQGSLKRHN